MICFRMLGTVELQDPAGRELRSVLRRTKLVALLGYLAAARPNGFHRRDQLLALLWPDLDEPHARNALRQAVHSLRSALGHEVLVARGDELGLDPRCLSSDSADFEQCVDSGELRAALELYRGDLLPAFHVPEVPEFERWLDSERAHLRRRAARAAVTLAQEEEAHGRTLPAARWAGRALEIDPYDEDALRRLLRLLDASGDRAEAIREFDGFARRLAVDLDLDPAPETRSLATTIRARILSRHDASDAVPLGVGLEREGLARPEDRADEPAQEDLDVIAISNRPQRVPTTDSRGVGTARRSIRGRRSHWLLALGGLSIALVGGLIGAWPWTRPSLDPTLVAVAPFDAHEPDLELWREGLVDVFARSLDGVGPFRTVPPTMIVRRWEGRVDRGSAENLAHRTGAGFVVFGQMLSAGPDSVRLRAAVLHVRRGETLIEVDRTDRTDRIDRLVDSASVDIIRTLVPATARTHIRLYSVGTGSLPALKSFVQGEYYFRRFALDSAVASFHRAVVIDTTFTLALHRLYAAIGWGGSAGPAVIDDLTRIRAVKHGLSPRDSLLMLSEWAGMGGGLPDHPAYFSNARRRATTLEEAARRYPEDPDVWYQLGELRWHSGHVFGASGDDARAAFDRAIALDSSFAPAYIHPVEVALNDNDAEAALRYVRGYLRIPSAHRERAGMLLLGAVLGSRSDPASDIDRAMETASPSALHRLADAVQSWPDEKETQLKVWPRALAAAGVTRSAGLAGTYVWPPPQASALATLLISRGHLKEARQLLGDQFGVPFMQLAELGAVPPDTVARVFDRWVREPEPDSAVYPFVLGMTVYHLFAPPCFTSMEAALWWAARRDTVRLRRLADREDAAMASDGSFDVRQYALFERSSQAVPVRTGGAQSVADTGNFEDVAVRHPITGFVRASLALAQGDTAGALDRFLAVPDSLCPDAPRLREIRFRLLVATGRGSEAAAVFDRSTDRWVPLVLERARLAERLGHRATAIKYYRFGAQAWIHADPELQPEVTDARAAVVRLGSWLDRS